jgi:branched-chain amino acid transport system substrate-binding protein
VTFSKDGEWGTPRVVWTQFQNIKGNDLEQFKDPSIEVVLLPQELRSGTLLWPYRSGRQ